MSGGGGVNALRLASSPPTPSGIALALATGNGAMNGAGPSSSAAQTPRTPANGLGVGPSVGVANGLGAALAVADHEVKEAKAAKGSKDKKPLYPSRVVLTSTCVCVGG